MEKRELKDILNTKLTMEDGKFVFTIEPTQKKEKKKKTKKK